MPNIKPVSDLRSYTAVLEEVSAGAPVFLTRNGRGCYAIVDIEDYELYEAERALLSKLDHGMVSAEERGTLSTSQLEQRLAERFAQRTA